MSKAVLEAVLAAVSSCHLDVAEGMLRSELDRLSTVMASEVIEWNFDIDACPFGELVILSTAPSDKHPTDSKRTWPGKKVPTLENERGWRFSGLATNSTPLAWAYAPKHVLEVMG